ncbi:MAG: thioredoxin family protein [Euryarchaeota archaeon]|nr:thioredoxin family protein [Euryarchaeota archaeon]
MKYLLLVFTLLAGLAGCTSAPEKKLPYNYREEALLSALAEGTPVVLEIAADWCRNCIEQQPIMEELRERFPEVTFLLADFDREKELVERYGVRGVPYFVLFDSSGREFARISGFQKKETLETLINQILHKNYVLNASFSTFEGLEDPEVKIENRSLVVIKTVALENLSIWGEGVEVAIGNLTLRIVNVTPDLFAIRDFETLNVTPGTPIEIVAELPSNYTLYEPLNLDIKIGIWDEACCGNYRDVLLWANLTAATAQ